MWQNLKTSENIIMSIIILTIRFAPRKKVSTFIDNSWINYKSLEVRNASKYVPALIVPIYKWTM